MAGAATPVVDLVIPTIGRPSLDVLFDVLTREAKAFDGRIVVVHDRPDASPSVWPRVPPPLEHRTVVLTGKGAGPAAARNVGWRAATAAWVAFLDDDVVPADGWGDALVDDLEGVDPGVAGVQGLIEVPLPLDRRPTDWERNVAGLETAAWATADMAYRRSVLEQVGGFDERFPRAYREDADLALRIMAVGGRLVSGQRHVRHPVGPTSPWTTVRRQAGNADDALMRAIHGRGWRHRVQAPRGRRRRHLATTALALGAVVATFAGGRRTARALATAWAGMTAEFAWTRIAPGPRTPGELATMVATSVAIPPAATAWWIRGFVRAWGAEPIRARGRVPRAVLFDRDGTLVVDVPYNGDPDRVVPAPGAKEAVERLRQAGVATAVISNQSGVARGLITADDVARVNAAVEEALGPLGPWLVCVHGPDDDCDCRKPAPGLVRRAARALGVAPDECVVVGDIGSDVEAAMAAGAHAILVPNPVTRPKEVAAAPVVASDLVSAVERILAGDLDR